MAKALGIDYGKARIGLAISDESYTIAKSIKILLNKSIDNTLQYIHTLIISENISHIVIGIPHDTNGNETKMSDIINAFVIDLKKYLESNKLNVETVLRDESLTTHIAYDNLLEKGYTHTKIKTVLDSEAARIILQEYLDNKNAI